MVRRNSYRGPGSIILRPLWQMILLLSIQWVQRLRLLLVSLLTLMVATNIILKLKNLLLDQAHIKLNLFIKKLTEVKDLEQRLELTLLSQMVLLVQMLTIKIQKELLYNQHPAMDSVLQKDLKVNIRDWQSQVLETMSLKQSSVPNHKARQWEVNYKVRLLLTGKLPAQELIPPNSTSLTRKLQHG